MMTEFNEWYSDWRKKIVSALGEGRDLFAVRKKVYPEFSEREVEFFETIVLEFLYCNNKFNAVILKLDVFNFSIKNAFIGADEEKKKDKPLLEGANVLMQIRFRVLYGYIIRCQSPYFCFSENDFERLSSFVHWRLHVIGSYCSFHFNVDESKLPAGVTSYFEILQRICLGYSRALTSRDRLIIMSRYFYFVSKLVSFVKVQRGIEFNKREE